MMRWFGCRMMINPLIYDVRAIDHLTKLMLLMGINIMQHQRCKIECIYNFYFQVIALTNRYSPNVAAFGWFDIFRLENKTLHGFLKIYMMLINKALWFIWLCYISDHKIKCVLALKINWVNVTPYLLDVAGQVRWRLLCRPSILTGVKLSVISLIKWALFLGI